MACRKVLFVKKFVPNQFIISDDTVMFRVGSYCPFSKKLRTQKQKEEMEESLITDNNTWKIDYRELHD